MRGTLLAWRETYMENLNIGRSGIEINQPPVSFSNSSMTSDDAGLLFSEPGFELDLTPSLFFLVITHLP